MPGVTHVRWLVRGFDPMLAFYRDALGFRVALDVPGTYVELDSGVARIGLYPAELMTAVVGERLATHAADDLVLGVQVDDVDKAVARLEQHGVPLTKPAHDQLAWRMRIAHVRDPDGHLIELWAPLGAA